MKKKLIISSLFVLSFFSVWFITYETLKPDVIYSDVEYWADFRDDRRVLWVVDNMFVWRVIENLWIAKDTWGSDFPRTDFKVEVLYNVKWKLKWEVVVRQQWGYKRWILVLRRWDTYIQEGEVYLFTASWNTKTIMSHPNWKHLITSDKNISEKELKKLIKENIKVKDFRKAYKDEIQFLSDSKDRIYKNKYKDLSEEEKEELKDFDKGFVE